MAPDSRSASWLPHIAAAVAFALAGFLLLSAVLNQVTLAPFALVPLLAGIGIVRRRVWSAYGFALFELAQSLLLIFTVYRNRSAGFDATQVALVGFINLCLIALFWWAGKSLAAAGAARGLAWPWITAAAVCTLPLLFLRPFVIPTGAMENTLLIGDHILAQTFVKRPLERGDIVIFYYPLDRKQIFVKRVIGLPGDRIRLVNKKLFRNGQEVNEPYVIHRFPFEAYRDDFPTGLTGIRLQPVTLEMLTKHVANGELVVPPGKYFVLGDNRDNSLDSRYWGFLDPADVLGKPFLIYDSTEPASSGKRALERERWNRILKPL